MSARFPTMMASLALWAIASPASAAEWSHDFAPYVWGAAMSGTTGVGGVMAETSLSFEDILGDLEFGFMGVYRATRDRCSVTVDVIYMGLGYTERGPGGLLTTETDMDQIGLEAGVGYALSERFSIVGGLRYVELDTEVDVSSPLGSVLSVREEQHWIDPVIGAEYSMPLADHWSLLLRGDVGGFGVGSNFAWQGLAILRWQLSPRFGAALAYRYLDMDYEDGRGDDSFKYDMAMLGPALGLVFTF